MVMAAVTPGRGRVWTPALVVSSHVMDEAGRCDSLVLLRDGRLVAATTPAQLRADAGTSDLEDAFLRVVRSQDEEVAA